MFSYFEDEYLDLLQYTLEKGQERPDRTDIGTSKFISGHTLTIDLSYNDFPILLSRKLSFKVAFEETMFFLRGQTDSKILEEKGIGIWKGNTSREELDKKGLQHLPEGSIGKAYSHQWRNFGGELGQNDGTDQVVEMLEGMKKDPYGRRHLITAWNPKQMHPDTKSDDELYEIYLDYHKELSK